MEPTIALKYLSGAMSLRAPQIKSLEIFADYLKSDSGQKLLARMKKESRDNTLEILEESKAYYGNVPEAIGFEDFERKFPAYTFALATGVGKTRLMGAFVAYLYLVYNIQHFLIVAPNLTIYRKLFDDFSRSNNPKYVFKGVQELNTNTIKVITTDNYALQRNASLFQNQIEINIFNIQQFAVRDMASERGITKAWETAGVSYFDYLKEHDDLVVMLDEAHHYHADVALGSLDILDPLFGLEMTATPYIGTTGSGKNARQIKMKNVVYSYNLGDAIRGKLVKDPWVGTEGDIDFSQFDSESIETDARKLQLASYFHERAKNALIEYAKENHLPLVKPVMLVVAKDTEHASQLRDLLDSDSFRGGEFKGKVLEIHTKLKGTEVDENIEKLISLENPNNIVEIVIHVNMLKEGWDVTNVYTIVPLRESAAAILTEQTIGRGLRLPYGERTGIPLVDRLVIVAHEQFSKVVALAKDSTLIQGQVEQISEKEIKEIKTLTEIQPVILDEIKKEIENNAVVMVEVKKKVEEEIRKIPQFESLAPSIQEKIVETKTNEMVIGISKDAMTKQTSKETSFGVDTLFGFSPEAIGEVGKIIKKAEATIEVRNIPIPRLMLTPSFGELVIEDFDLDTSVLRTYTNERAIVEEQLQNTKEENLLGEDVPGRRVTQVTRVSSFGGAHKQTPQNTVIAALLDFPLLDYEDEIQKPLLIKLADQATSFYRLKAIDEDNLSLIVESNARTIAEDINKQILIHKELKFVGYQESVVGEPRPFAESNNISLGFGETPVSLDSQVDTFSAKYVYGSFKKACHRMYRFDSSDEARLAYIFERDEQVEDWLRPASNQFEGLFWRDAEGESHHRYEPDFVVELSDEIVMIEVKPEGEINDPSVQSKKQTAEKYCEVVNRSMGKPGIKKPWRYIIIPTEKIKLNSTITGLLK